MLSIIKYLLSLFFFLIVKTRIYFYRKKFFKTYSFNTKIISIGNLSFGGTGKTPLAISLTNYLSLNNRTAILLKGYKSSLNNNVVILKSSFKYDNILLNSIGDEAKLAYKKLVNSSLIVSKDKTNGVKTFLSTNLAKFIIIDDGFSHLKLKKDLNIVLIDSNEGFKNKFTEGTLREPYSSLRRADILIFTKANFISEDQKEILKNKANEYNNLKIFFFKSKLSFSKEILDKNIIVLSAIFNPNFFYKMLENQGYNIVHKIKFYDHYKYSKKDILYFDNLKKQLNCKNIVCTHKDFVKLVNYSNDFIVADYEHEVDQAFYKLIEDL